MVITIAMTTIIGSPWLKFHLRFFHHHVYTIATIIQKPRVHVLTLLHSFFMNNAFRLYVPYYRIIPICLNEDICYAMKWLQKNESKFFYSKTYSKIIFVEWGGFRGLTTTNYMAFLAIFATNYQLFCIIFTNYLIWTPHFNNYQLSHYRHDIFFWETISILKILPFPIQLLRCKHRLHQFTNLSKCI